MTPTIPYRERGYSVDLDTVTVHERYQDHAPNARRTRSILGVLNAEMSTGQKATPCPLCFPALPKGKVKRWAEERPVTETEGAFRLHVEATPADATVTHGPHPEPETMTSASEGESE